MEKDIKILGETYLDIDSDPKINKGSDYTLNTIIQSDGRFGVAVNIKGNELVTDQSLLNSLFNISYTIKVVGSCIDEARNRIIYMVSNSSDGSRYSGIFYYDITDGSNKLIFGNIGLLFTYTSVINAAIVGDFLTWTDGNQPVMEINYIRAYNYTNSISTTYKYSTLTVDMCRLYKKPYDGVITLTGVNNSTDLLTGKSFQFALRYTYVDYQKSVLSQFSEMFWCDYTFLSNGYGLYASYDQIVLTFTIPTTKDILRTELFVRENENTNWYLYDTIETTGVTTYTFDNSKLKEEIDQDDINRPYDFIPKLATSLEIIEKDKIALGNITEEFDPTIVNVNSYVRNKSFTWDQQNATVYSRMDSYYWYFTIDSITFGSNGISCVILHLPLRLVKSAEITNIAEAYKFIDNDVNISVDLATTNDDIYLIYPATSTTTRQNIMAYFFAQLGNIFADDCWKYGGFYNPTYHFDYPWTDSGHTNCIRMMRIPYFENSSDYNGNNTCNILSIDLHSYLPLPSVKTLKNIDSYLGSIVYFDKDLRYSTVNRFPSVINTPFGGETSFPSYFEIWIKNKPPTWAYYYCLAFSKRNKVDFFLQLKIVLDQDYFFGTDGYLRIRLQKILNKSRELVKNSTLPSYEWENGDMLMIMLAYTSSVTKDGTSVFRIIGQEYPKDDISYMKDYSTNIDYILDINGNKIYDTSSSFIVIDIKNNEYLYTYLAPTYISFTIEIYRNKKITEKVFYFHDTIHAIGNPGTSNNYHIGDSQNQNPITPSTVPAKLSSNFGDCYYRQRFAKRMFICVDGSYTDFYTSNYCGVKSPNYYDQDAGEINLTSSLRYGGALIQDTKINRLNKFKSEDILNELKEKFGGINSLKEVGNVLKVLQDKKETSIYVGRTEMKNSDGSSNIISSTSVLGTANSADENRGCIFPKAVVSHNRNIYYPDIYTGEIIRSSPNGQYPISEYGMRTYFKNKFKEILGVGIGNVDIIGSFDEENKMYLITFIISGNSETLGFYDSEMEGSKPRWISYFSFIPEHYAYVGTELLSFKNGLGYSHNSNNVNRCTFYGVKYKQQINWYSNALPLAKKIFRMLGIKSNKKWDVPILLIEADASYTRGMKSKIPATRFELKEGQFYSDYLNNMLTTSSAESVLDLFNGDTLRGNYLKHQIENLEDVEVWILECEVGYDASNKY